MSSILARVFESLTLHAAICIDCLASATDRDLVDVMLALQLIAEKLEVHAGDRACGNCGTTAAVVSLTESGL